MDNAPCDFALTQPDGPRKEQSANEACYEGD